MILEGVLFVFRMLASAIVAGWATDFLAMSGRKGWIGPSLRSARNRNKRVALPSDLLVLDLLGCRFDREPLGE